ncbi:MAG TPA: ammonium transporter [Phycisphaerae bacterium]|nr:ammonium transporter [Phycisphaerae bacterium]
MVVPLVTWAQTSAPAPADDTAKAIAALPVYANPDPAAKDGSGNLLFPDPTGANSGAMLSPGAVQPDAKGNNAITGDDPNTYVKENTPKLYDKIAHNTYAINMVWTLIEGFLVMFMQLGFAMVETGLTRAKNAAHTFAMNMMIYPLGCIAFWAYGFAIGWGNWFNAPVGPGWYSTLGPGTAVLNSGWVINGWTLLGTKGFFLNGCSDTGVLALFFFMMVFMDTTATIPTGTMCERWRWGNFCLYGLFVALPYCIFGCWAWGGGWLAQLGVKAGLGHGYVDFAGSGVVHLMGGIIGLIGAIVIGPRIGKFVNGKPVAIPGHDLPMVMGGTFVLAFGWFGFNPGSTLAGTDLRISVVVVNTMLAGVAAALASMVVMQLKFGKPDPSMMCNGMLAGLVAITAPSGFVSPLGSVVIGLIAGVLVVYSVFFWDNMGVDDPVGAVSVHGVNGFFGVLCVGLFATGEYGGGWNGVTADGFSNNVVGIMPIGSVAPGIQWFSHMGWGQLGAEAIGAVTCCVLGGVLSFAWFKVSNLIVPMRAAREVEIQGCDIPEVGALAYPDFELKTAQSVTDVSPAVVKV